MKKFGKRLGALMIGSAMLTTTVAASGLMAAMKLTADAAAGKTITVGQELAKDDTYKSLTSDIADGGVKTLQFNFSADVNVGEFVYYFGASLAADPWYCETKADGVTIGPQEKDANGDPINSGSFTCYPYAKEFSVVLDLSGVELAYDVNEEWPREIQFQNCYTGDLDGGAVTLTLESIVVNGTDDTSNGDPDAVGNMNTGGAGYTTKRTLSGSSEFTDNKNGTATLKSTITKKIDDVGAFYKEIYGTDKVVLTPGENYSEESYATVDENDVYQEKGEEQIRKEGLPLNSHKFAYKDFGVRLGASETSEIQIESLKVVLKTDDEKANVTRVMYGGGLNVEGRSIADTEYVKNQAGLKLNKNAGYWYNDLGIQAYETTMADIEAYNAANDPDVAFGVTVENGKNLIKQNFGNYVEVTWDVPEEVVPYTTVKDTDTISFQLWYGQVTDEEGTTTDLESMYIDSAALTYTQSITFPYQSKVTKTVNEKLNSGDGNEFKFADFGIEYEYTADVYGIEFTLSAAQGIDNLVLGAGTSVRGNCSGATSTNWFQAQDCPSPEEGNTITLINADESKKEYTFMWLIPGAVATGLVKNADTGAYEGKGTNYISTEQEGDNFKLAAYYAGWKDEASDIAVTVENITLYYTTDDRNNSAKADMFEPDLYVRPALLEMEVGDEETLEVNVEDCTFKSGDIDIITVDNNGKVTAVGAGQTTITVETPHGQVETIDVIVKVAFVPLYGDTNLDGVVSLIDVVYLNKYNAGGMTFNANQMENANCVYDNAVNQSDSTILLQYLVELVDKLGPGAVAL
ncbi:MAG: DUF5620 domain-containing protein [Oscillospiraceae bacterium]|nr:DUF5620 domain-containing protein [Oscillospiraceae bacterium]